MFFGQLICYGCHHILTYPLGAVTCRCRICGTVNSAQHIQVTCAACGQLLHAPINTLSLLCPCCGTVTEIPEELLPPLPSCVNLGDGTEEMETAIYVSHPTLPPLPAAPAAAAATAKTPAAASTTLTPKTQGRLSREEREAAQSNDSDDEDEVQTEDGVYESPHAGREQQEGAKAEDEGATGAPPVASRPVVPMHLAPTVMIATRIL